MKKAIRQQVYEKCNGHCAYCGKEITYKQMQVDHIQPAFHNWDERTFAVNPGVTKGTDDLDNLNPACARCNKWKATFSIEHFREEIAEQTRRLRDYSSNYRMALDYGLVQETALPVEFYFEKMNRITKVA